MNFSLNIDGNLQQGAKLAASALEKFEKTLGSGSKALDNFEKKAATGVKALGEMGSESGSLTARSVALGAGRATRPGRAPGSRPRSAPA